MPKTVNPEQQKKTRNALFQVAARAFLRDGYTVTGMKALAAEAGCTTGKFYCYYSGKEEILTELMEALLRGNKEAAERIAARKKDPFYGVLAFLSLIRHGADSYPNLREIYREGLSEPAGRAVAEQMLKEILAGEPAPETELRIRAAVRAIPAFLENDEADRESRPWEEHLFLTMLSGMLGKDPETAGAYAERVSADTAAIREKAYDVLVKLLQGPKKRNVKKM
ncbi:MAG: TetR/AcrR family transcriptional regulator [Lachnospiraceae bacterium]|nr:TetR/AcrR family transcriptional regulator [Lachnospiraceae bacterium]